MVTYVCIGIVFLFTGIRIALYYIRARRTPEPQDLERSLLSVLRQGRREAR